MKKKLHKVELQIIDLFANDPEYSLHRCPDHGVHAHRKSSVYTGCPTCHQPFPVVSKEQLLEENEKAEQ